VPRPSGLPVERAGLLFLQQQRQRRLPPSAWICCWQALVQTFCLPCWLLLAVAPLPPEGVHKRKRLRKVHSLKQHASLWAATGKLSVLGADT